MTLSQSKGRMRREAGLTQSDRHVASDKINIIPGTTVKGETL